MLTVVGGGKKTNGKEGPNNNEDSFRALSLRFRCTRLAMALKRATLGTVIMLPYIFGIEGSRMRAADTMLNTTDTLSGH